MKKITILILALFVVFGAFFINPFAEKAEAATWCDGLGLVGCCDESNKGAVGLVPCGRIGGIVAPLACRCELYHVYFLIANVYKFIVWRITLPLVGLFIVIGGVLLLLGGGYPKFHEMGKHIIWGAAIGAGLVLGSWIIIGLLFLALGFGGVWWASFPISP